MTRKSPGVNTIEDLRQRCYIDEEGHWIWRGAFTVHKNGYMVGSIWSPALARTITLAKAIGLLTNRQPRDGRLWFRACTHRECANPAHYRIGTRSEMGKHSRPSNTPLHNALISASRRAASGDMRKVVAQGASIFNLGG